MPNVTERLEKIENHLRDLDNALDNLYTLLNNLEGRVGFHEQRKH